MTCCSVCVVLEDIGHSYAFKLKCHPPPPRPQGADTEEACCEAFLWLEAVVWQGWWWGCKLAFSAQENNFGRSFSLSTLLNWTGDSLFPSKLGTCVTGNSRVVVAVQGGSKPTIFVSPPTPSLLPLLLSLVSAKAFHWYLYFPP